MITRKELEDYAQRRGFKNIGHAEKDYFQTILLFILYQQYGSELVFKGGTALAKCYGLNRFSEDLDFTCKTQIHLKKIEDGLKRFTIHFEMTERVFERSKTAVIKIEGPLFNGNKNSTCKLILDFSFREEILVLPLIKTLGRFLEEIPSFDVAVMSQEEIFAEKIRAMLTRNKARDMYDLFFLVQSGLKLNRELVHKKLEYYHLRFSQKEFIKAVENKKGIWESELSGLIEHVPDFKEASRQIRKILTDH